MKKLISIILASVMLLSLFIINAGAENNEDFTLEEAEELFHEAFNRIYIINNLFCNANEDEYFNDIPPELIGGVYRDSSSPSVICRKAPDGTNYSIDEKFNVRYAIVIDERFSNMEKCYAYAKEVLTDNLSKVIIDDTAFSEEIVPTFRKAGEDFFVEGELPVGITVTSDTMLYLVEQYGGQFRAKFKSADKLIVNSNTAVMIITCEASIGLSNSKDISATVEFVNTENGWRISGGTYIDYLTFNKSLNELVNTSDPTALYLLPLALIPLAAPLVMKRRRDF